MTISLPETPDPAPATSEHPSEHPSVRERVVPYERLLDLAALFLLLTVTAVLYLLIGPSAGMVTGIATGLFTTYRRSGIPPAGEPADPPGPTASGGPPPDDAAQRNGSTR